MKLISLIFATFLTMISSAEEYLAPVKIDLGNGILVDLQLKVSETNRYMAVVRGLEGTQRSAFITCETIFEGEYLPYNKIPLIVFQNLGSASYGVDGSDPKNLTFKFERNIGNFHLMNRQINLTPIQSGHISPIRTIRSCLD